jgi:hypothetical protein
VSMNRQGWLTRTAATRVQGQSEIETPLTPTPLTPSRETMNPEVRRAN